MIGEVSMLESSEGAGEGRGWDQDSDGVITARARPVFSQVWSQARVDKHRRYDYSKRELSRKIRGQNAARCYLKWRWKQHEEEGGGCMEPPHHTHEHSYRAATFSANNSTTFILILAVLFNFFECSQGT